MQADATERGARAGYLPFFLASLYAAGTLAFCLFVGYGGQALGGIAAGVAFVIAFVCAFVLTPVFFVARRVLGEVAYLLLHLLIGGAIGINRSAPNLYAEGWLDLVLVPDSLMVIMTSLAAWLFVVLSVTAGQPSRKRPESWSLWRWGVLFVGFFTLHIPTSVSETPTDPSCHNVFLGGRQSASPSVRMNFELSERERQLIGSWYDRFAASQALRVRRHRSPSRSMCNDDIVFRVGGVFEGARHGVTGYPHDGGEDWQPVTGALICYLEDRIDRPIRFTGGGGEDIERPEFALAYCAPPDAPATGVGVGSGSE
ncbi:MAG: hypothetical protein AAF574_10610 [Pseudomonadota bacterium]